MHLNNVLTSLKSASQFGLDFIKEFCLKFIIKESNFNNIVNSKEFETLDQPLMVEIIRRRQAPPQPLQQQQQPMQPQPQHQRPITTERDGSFVQIPAASPPCIGWSPGAGGLPFVSTYVYEIYCFCVSFITVLI